MSYPINYPTPQGANIQVLYKTDDWVKPQGASFVWFTLIGAGGGGNNVLGGGSGAVTNCMVPAFLVPDVLRVVIGRGAGNANGTTTDLIYQQKNGTGYTLLTADAGLTGPSAAGGTASVSNFFSCMGFFQSISGQAGSSGATAASTTTFLSGGAGGSATANYGYASTTYAGFFQMRPIIVGTGGANDQTGGIGCGGGATFGKGGDGLAVIITW